MSSKWIAAVAIGVMAGLTLVAGAASASPALTLSTGKVLSGPGADYATLATLPAGAHVDVIWCGTRQNWCLIKQHNKMGWVEAIDLNIKPGGGTDVVADDGGMNGGNPGNNPIKKSQPAASTPTTIANQPGSGGPGSFHR